MAVAANIMANTKPITNVELVCFEATIEKNGKIAAAATFVMIHVMHARKRAAKLAEVRGRAVVIFFGIKYKSTIGNVTF